jgi:hypothetical protein
MSLITFEVVDKNCQNLDISFFPPQVRMTTVSSSVIGKIIGFSALDGSARKFRTCAWTGSSEQQLWRSTTNVNIGGDTPCVGYFGPSPNTSGVLPPDVNADAFAVQAGAQSFKWDITNKVWIINPDQSAPFIVGAARYDYSGADTIDLVGNNTGNHSKLLSVLCDGDLSGKYVEIFGTTTIGTGIAISFLGYRGIPGVPIIQNINADGSTSVPPTLGGPAAVLCTQPPSIPYLPVGDRAIRGNFDRSSLWGSASLNSSNLGVSNFVVHSATFGDSTDAGSSITLILQYVPLASTVNVAFSIVNIGNFFVGGSVVYMNAYSCTLSDEYTESDAINNGVSTIGSSSTASNTRNGFTIIETSVVATFNCTNLLVGTSYTLRYELWNMSIGTVGTVEITFIATDQSMQIVRAVPLPPRGQSITVKNPRINFSP